MISIGVVVLLAFIVFLFFAVTLFAVGEGMFKRGSDAIFFLAPVYAICWVLPSVVVTLIVTHFFM